MHSPIIASVYLLPNGEMSASHVLLSTLYFSANSLFRLLFFVYFALIFIPLLYILVILHKDIWTCIHLLDLFPCQKKKRSFLLLFL